MPSFCISNDGWLDFSIFYVGPDASDICRDLVEQSSDEEDSRQRMERNRQIARRRKKRPTGKYNLRQFNKSPRVQKCLVRLSSLPRSQDVVREGPKDIEPEEKRTDRSLNYDSDGSIDDLIKSSSESEESHDSIEIMSLSEEEGCPRPTPKPMMLVKPERLATDHPVTSDKG